MPLPPEFNEVERATERQQQLAKEQFFIKSISLTNDANEWYWKLKMALSPCEMKTLNITAFLLEKLAQITDISAHDSNLYTIFSELYVNALDHGILQLNSDLKVDTDGFFCYFRERDARLAKLAEGEIKIELALDCKDNEHYKLTLQINDTGQGFLSQKKQTSKQPNETYSGRGLKLTSKLCTLTYSTNGTQATAIYKWSSSFNGDTTRITKG